MNFKIKNLGLRILKLKAKSQKLKAGFSLVELMVVISIFVIMTTVLILNYNKFGGNLLITNLAYDVALTIREAQTYGIGVKQATYGGGATTFDAGYGVHFDWSSPTTYILFYDAGGLPGGDKIYNTGEAVRIYELKNGNEIETVCGAYAISIDEFECNSSPPGIDIVFYRPNPEAYINASEGGASYDKIRVCLKSPQGKRKAIITHVSGQISVQNIDNCWNNY